MELNFHERKFSMRTLVADDGHVLRPIAHPPVEISNQEAKRKKQGPQDLRTKRRNLGHPPPVRFDSSAFFPVALAFMFGL
jgi:hypothetical protein